MQFYFLLILIGGTLYAAQQQTQIPVPGVVHPSVKVAADASNSYALYLPSAYSTTKRWPLLLVFDPLARGETSVKLFHEASEKYGFIVVSSNNSRNFQDPSAAIQLLWRDVNERYSIDPNRIYTAGLSGGARVASSVALRCKSCIAGVIANGAGLPQAGTTPPPEVADWFLVAGTADFNYPELLHLKEALETHNAASRFVVYEGPHGWMPPEFAEQALAWLQLRAMARRLVPADKEFIDSQFGRRIAEAQSAQKAGDLLAAARAYREIAADFRGFRETKEQEAEARALTESEGFRKAKKEEKAALDLQDDLAAKIGGLVAGIAQGPDQRAELVAQLQSAVSDAIRNQRQASTPGRKHAIERGLASAFAHAAETGQQEMLKKDFFAARDMFQAGEIIQPDSAWACYLLATAYAQLGKKKQAVQELNKALEKGMSNRKALDDSAFDTIRSDEGFRQIEAKLSGGTK